MCEREPYGPRTARPTPSARRLIDRAARLLWHAAWQALWHPLAIIRWRLPLPPTRLRVVGCGHDVRAAHRHLKACERRETCTRPSGEVEGFGLRAGCALAHRMCRVWAPAPLTRPRESIFTQKVHCRPGNGERGDCDGRVDECAYLVIPAQPTFTEQRLVSTHRCWSCA